MASEAQGRGPKGHDSEPTDRLVLVRHAPTVPQAGVNSAQWELDRSATELTNRLARQMAARTPVDLVVTSHEPKAVGTGRTLAAALGVRSLTAPDLEEHHRKRTALMEEAEWQRTIKRFFGSPHVLLFGQETGAEARRRFERGLRAVQEQHADKRLAVVSHATVITLLLAGPNGVAPYELWRTFRMPEAVVVNARTLEIIERFAPDPPA